MKRRRRGEGTVCKRKDGRYEVAIYLHTPLGHRRVRQYTRTRVEADSLLVELRKKNEQGLLMTTAQQRFGDYMKHWLSVIETTVRPSTFTSYENTVRLYLEPHLGQRYLTKLSFPDVQSFLDSQLKLGKSVRNVQKMRVVLSSILQQASREELISRNVARLTKLPSYHPKEVTPWNLNQLGIFLESASGNHFYAIYVLMSLYGLRAGEALGLSWSDVDLENNVIHIHHQVHYENKTYVYSDVKTRAGRRNLPLIDIVVAALRDVSRNDLGPLPDLIFKTSGNLPIDNGKLRKSFKRISEDAGLPVITLHHLRHTAATNLKNLGTSAKETQSILGHANITTTLQIYQHSNSEERSKALEQYEQKLVGLSASSRQIQPSNEKIIA